VQEYDVDSEDEVKKLINDDEFIRSAIDRFNQMAISLNLALHGN
jgi:hypothetical protein